MAEVTEVTCTMAESEENEALVDSAVSTSSVASTSTDSETHRNVSNYWVIFSIFYSIKLSSTTSDITFLTMRLDERHSNSEPSLEVTFFREGVIRCHNYECKRTRARLTAVASEIPDHFSLK